MAKYLYNGVELPALPEWDKEAYPYAYIGEQAVNSKILFVVYSVPKTYGGSAIGIFGTANSGGVYWVENDKWVTCSQYPQMQPIWANTDILNEDGSVWLAASVPVPVTVLTARDLYRKINGKPTKLTLYKKINGELKQIQLNEGEI